MTMINPFEGAFWPFLTRFDSFWPILTILGSFFDKKNPASIGGKRSKDPMEDIFGVSGGYAPYLGTGPGTINAPFEMDNDYDSVPSTSRDSAATNGIDRRGSLQNNRQSPTGKLSRLG